MRIKSILLLLFAFFPFIFASLSSEEEESIFDDPSEDDTDDTDDSDQTPVDFLEATIGNSQNFAYYLTTRVGEIVNNAFFVMLVDTGSPWVWIADSDCENCLFSSTYYGSYDSATANYYNCTSNKRTCSQDKSNLVSLMYDFGMVNAYVGREKFSFAGLPLNFSIHTSMFFAHQISEEFYGIQADGVLGLGIDPQTKTSPILDFLYNQNVIKNRSFSLYLSNNYLNIDQDAKLVLGGYNPDYMSKTSTEFQYAPLVPGVNAWAIQISNFSMGNASLLENPVTAVLSTMFPDIGVPKGYLKLIVSQLNQKGCDCMIISEYLNPVCRGTVYDMIRFPKLTFEGEGVVLNLTYKAYVTYITNSNYSGIPLEPGYHIVVGIREINTTQHNKYYEDKWIFGADFQRFFYILYDQENSRIGFSLAKNSAVVWERSSLWISGIFTVAIGFTILAVCILLFRFCQQYRKLRRESMSVWLREDDEFNGFIEEN